MGIANLRLYRQMGARRPIVIFGIAVVLVTTVLLVIHMWTDARQTLVAIRV